MLRPRFSFSNMLLVITIIGMAIYLGAQHSELAKFRELSKRHADELGVIGDVDGQSIAMRRLAAKGEFNTWRFRISKPHTEYEYCFGIADVDPSGDVHLPTEYRRNYQIVESNSMGETEVVLNVWQGPNSRWYMKLEELEGHATKKATAYRADGFSEKVVSSIVQRKSFPFDGQFGCRYHSGGPSHSDVVRFDKDETVWLFRSENAGQPAESRQAFVLALRPRPERRQAAE